ncbi:hypothetical protein SAMN05660657_05359 [Geodermatophilus amargosae]|uniref:Uncharacterized protein n=1 Tax=Geodermatophilus amargosae TaxID=1296565 RepID=A0A1I7D681_9ACTN|nr:hypothetical protein SAMN05660657_05359 [Geodermatophilus amargosae]
MFAHAHVPATADAIGAEASRHVHTSDVWFSVNPVAVPEGYGGRGTAAHVTRWAGTYSDLDVKAGGLPSMEAAEAVIDAVSTILGQDPVIVIESGHGLQPGWGMDPEDEGTDLSGDEERRATARALMRRFGRLMTHVASLVDEEHRGHVDSVFDLARVLRLPGTVNRKDPDVPVPTGARFPGGGLLSVAELDDALLACGIAELPGDRDDPGEVRSKPGDWPWSKKACPYVHAVVEGWCTDKADDPSQRHQWLVGQSVRLACMHRWGCLTEELHTQGVQTLANRMAEVCNRGEVRKVQPGEIADALSWGQAHASTKTDEEVAREVGGHAKHEPLLAGEPIEPGDQRTPLQRLVDQLGTWIDGSLDQFVIMCAAYVSVADVDSHLDPLWLLQVGNPAAGKTESLDLGKGMDGVESLDEVTVAGLLSWRRSGKNVYPAGALARLGDDPKDAVITIGDLSTMLADQGRRSGSDLDNVFAALRRVYDGHYVRSVGTLPSRWSGKGKSSSSAR